MLVNSVLTQGLLVGVEVQMYSFNLYRSNHGTDDRTRNLT